ncbi:MAG: NAD(P)H-dependent oxidoreductase [Candidatus Cloacimonetes bacterium]|nr:NAD(P)H-dependent oxidoreductase [Candidatus Cloacimonadota bacterium]
MNVLIIYAHPYEGSFNKAILTNTIEGLNHAGHQYELIDLNGEGFNPVLTREELEKYPEGEYLDPMVGEYLTKIKAADHLVFIFPIWWGGVPAILKGFFDKVLLKKQTYDFKGKWPQGKLKGKSATVISTMNSPKIFYNLIGKAPIKHTVINGSLKLCGIKPVKWIEFSEVLSISQIKREGMLDRILDYFTNL